MKRSEKKEIQDGFKESGKKWWREGDIESSVSIFI